MKSASCAGGLRLVSLLALGLLYAAPSASATSRYDCEGCQLNPGSIDSESMGNTFLKVKVKSYEHGVCLPASGECSMDPCSVTFKIFWLTTGTPSGEYCDPDDPTSCESFGAPGTSSDTMQEDVPCGVTINRTWTMNNAGVATGAECTPCVNDNQ